MPLPAGVHAEWVWLACASQQVDAPTQYPPPTAQAAPSRGSAAAAAPTRVPLSKSFLLPAKAAALLAVVMQKPVLHAKQG